MTRASGNQHASRKVRLRRLLYAAYSLMTSGNTEDARKYMGIYRRLYAEAPASTRRRCKCGR